MPCGTPIKAAQMIFLGLDSSVAQEKLRLVYVSAAHQNLPPTSEADFRCSTVCQPTREHSSVTLLQVPRPRNEMIIPNVAEVRRGVALHVRVDAEETNERTATRSAVEGVDGQVSPSDATNNVMSTEMTEANGPCRLSHPITPLLGNAEIL